MHCSNEAKDATGDDLGLARSTVYRKMRRHQLPWSDDDRIDEDERLLRKRARSRALELRPSLHKRFRSWVPASLRLNSSRTCASKPPCAPSTTTSNVAQVLGIAAQPSIEKLKKMEVSYELVEICWLLKLPIGITNSSIKSCLSLRSSSKVSSTVRHLTLTG